MRTETPSSMSFHLLALERVDAEMTATYFTKSNFGLLAVVEGSLLITSSDLQVTLSAGEIIIWPPDSELAIDGEYCTYYYIEYQVFKPQSNEQVILPSELQEQTFCLEKVSIPLRSLLRGLEQLYRHAWSADWMQQCKNHLYFQEWMMLIITEQRKQLNEEHNSMQAVEQTIAYIHAFYYEELTVEQLAIKAGMSRRQFSYLFQKLTNRSITSYVTSIRIEEAKKLLIDNQTVATVAKAIGYQDEYYFSRRFKQIVGISPLQYVQQKTQAVKTVKLAIAPMRIVADQYMGQLLSLGMTPIGARTGMLVQDYLAPLQVASIGGQQIVDMGKDFFVTANGMKTLRPDLIITQMDANYRELELIAPTVVIPYGQTLPHTKLRLISEAIGKANQAEHWIESYEYRIERARSQIISSLGTSFSVTNLLLLDNQLYVLGPYSGYGSYSLYQALQLQVPDKQYKELNELNLSVEISPRHISSYAGDIIFLTAYGDTSILTETDEWKDLHAVRTGNVFYCNPYRFAFEDPFSLDEQLKSIGHYLQLVTLSS